jgi:hypothetical protein
MSDEEKRDNWFSGTVGKLDLSERRMRTTSSVSDVKPIPVVNSSPKSEVGSVAMFAEFDEEIERRQRAEKTRGWMQKNRVLVEEERKASDHERIRKEEPKVTRDPSQTRADEKNDFIDPRPKPPAQRSLNEGNNGGYDNTRWFCATKR